MGAVFVIKQNDLQPYLRATLLEADGDPVDLAGKTVRFVMRADGAAEAKVDAVPVVVDEDAGIVEYHWAEGDTDTPGTYKAEFKVESDEAGERMTIPNSEYITVRVEKELG